MFVEINVISNKKEMPVKLSHAIKANIAKQQNMLNQIIKETSGHLSKRPHNSKIINSVFEMFHIITVNIEQD